MRRGSVSKSRSGGRFNGRATRTAPANRMNPKRGGIRL